MANNIMVNASCGTDGSRVQNSPDSEIKSQVQAHIFTENTRKKHSNLEAGEYLIESGLDTAKPHSNHSSRAVVSRHIQFEKVRGSADSTNMDVNNLEEELVKQKTVDKVAIYRNRGRRYQRREITPKREFRSVPVYYARMRS